MHLPIEPLFWIVAAISVTLLGLAKGGFTGPSGSIAWLAAEVHPKAERFAIDMDPTHFSLDKVAFKRFPLQMQLHTVVEAAVNLSSRLKDAWATSATSPSRRIPT